MNDYLLFPTNKLHNRFVHQVFRWKYYDLTNRKFFSQVNFSTYMWIHGSVKYVSLTFLIGTWDIKARFDERFARVHELCLYCVLAWSANSLRRENHQVGCYWMLVITGSMHNTYWVPWKKLWWLSGEFCLWTCVLLNLVMSRGKRNLGVAQNCGVNTHFCFCCFLPVSLLPSIPSKALHKKDKFLKMNFRINTPGLPIFSS